MSKLVYLILKYQFIDLNLNDRKTRGRYGDASIVGIYENIETAINQITDRLIQNAKNKYKKNISICNLNHYIDDETFQQFSKEKSKYSTIEWEHIEDCNKEWKKREEKYFIALAEETAEVEEFRKEFIQYKIAKIFGEVYEIRIQMLQ